MDITTQAIFPMWTGNPRDIISNTMHWTSDLLPADRTAVAVDIADRLSGFYNSVYSAAGTAGNYVEWALARVEMIIWDDPMPRIPEVAPMTLTFGSSNATMPSDVAVCSTVHAAPVSGTPRQRLHNRIYIGGLSGGVISSTPGESPQVSLGFRNTVAAAAAALHALNDANLTWVQRSFTPVLTNRPITGGWVDSEPDTQRRRGTDPSTRSSWTA